MSMRLAAGSRGRPGIVMVSPQIGMTNSAPAPTAARTAGRLHAGHPADVLAVHLTGRLPDLVRLVAAATPQDGGDDERVLHLASASEQRLPGETTPGALR
jgi:hypothetical protein